MTLSHQDSSGFVLQCPPPPSLGKWELVHIPEVKLWVGTEGASLQTSAQGVRSSVRLSFLPSVLLCPATRVPVEQGHSGLAGFLSTPGQVLDVAHFQFKETDYFFKGTGAAPWSWGKVLQVKTWKIWMQWDTEHQILKDFGMGGGTVLRTLHSNKQRRKK